MNLKFKKDRKIVVIGGGTGTFVALSGLKKYTPNLFAIVTMMDTGGSSGRLRDELGVLPPGDIRQCLVALSTSDQLMRDIFNYRFQNGDLGGHSFGNIFLSTLEKVTGSMEEAIKTAGEILRVSGRVIPVTLDKVQLCVELSNNKIIKGENHIDEPKEKTKRPRIKKAYLEPQAKALPEAKEAILEADLVLIGPGDLYTSIIPNLLVKGIKKVLNQTRAKIVFALNLMTKYGQTGDYKAQDHLRDLIKYLGSNNLDYVLVNTRKPKKEALEWYKKYHEEMVIDDLKNFLSPKIKIMRKDLLKDTTVERDFSDKLRRSFIRHNPEKLAVTVMKILYDQN